MHGTRVVFSAAASPARVGLVFRSAATSENPKAVFHESLSILVEQGTDVVLVELPGTQSVKVIHIIVYQNADC